MKENDRILMIEKNTSSIVNLYICIYEESINSKNTLLRAEKYKKKEEL